MGIFYRKRKKIKRSNGSSSESWSTSNGAAGGSGGGGGTTVITETVSITAGDVIKVDNPAPRSYVISHDVPVPLTGQPVQPAGMVIKNVEFDAYGHAVSKEEISLTGALDSRYLRKDAADHTQYPITFYGGAVFGDYIRSLSYVSGLLGSGWELGMSSGGTSSLTVDILTVRQQMRVMELIIEKIKSVGGQIVVSAANGIIKSVMEMPGIAYQIEFEGDQQFEAGDLIRCQTFTGSNLKSYWVRVAYADTQGIRVNMSEFDVWNTVPDIGDECVLMGSNVSVRSNFITIAATGDGEPRLDVYNGVNMTNTANKLRLRAGCLNGITNSLFNGDNPSGYGLYCDNAYLYGKFVLTTGEDVRTRFEITDGRITQYMGGVYNSTSGFAGNILSNPSFMNNFDKWYKNKAVATPTESINGFLLFLYDGGMVAQYIQNLREPLKLGRYVFTMKYKMIRSSDPSNFTFMVTLGGDYYQTANITQSMTDYGELSVTLNVINTGVLFTMGITGSGHSMYCYDLCLKREDDFDALAADIVNLQTQITQTVNSISLLATKDYVDTLTGNINASLQAAITVTANDITAIASRVTAIETASAGWVTTAQGNLLWATKSEYNTLNQLVSQHTTSIAQNATDILLRATKTELNTLSTTLQGYINVNATNITAAVTRITALENASAGWVTTAQGNLLWATKTDYNTLKDTVMTNSSSITQLSNSITSVVQSVNAIDGTEIVSRINQTSSSVRIDASHIYLNGSITANGNVFINTDGTIKAVNAQINGILSVPFKRLEDSDATKIGDGYWMNRDINLILPHNNITLYLPSAGEYYNGCTVNITTSYVWTYSDVYPSIGINGGGSFVINGENTRVNPYSPGKLYITGGVMQIMGIFYGNGILWTVLTPIDRTVNN